MSESKLQQACINYFRYRYPKELIYAIPNGGLRNKIVAKKLKNEGVLRGVPDICIPSRYMYIELKYGRNKPTKQQLEIMELLKSYGYKVYVVYSFDEFKKIVDNS